MSDQTPVLECKDLCISYFTRAGEIPAVVDFNLTVMPGEAVGIVGESGCGKSTVALAIMQYMGKNGRVMSGEIKFKGRDMTAMSEHELRSLRGSQISMVYQEPMASLNPSMKIAEQLIEVPRYHESCSDKEAYARALEMLGLVRLPDPKRIMESFPHQISGGQQQRVVIAMALLSNPALLLLDEPTTALDVTVEAGIVQLIKEISGRFGTSMIYISHNLGLILETCDRITVMYSGEAVEVGTVAKVFDRMRHPYTKGLFNSIPLPGADKYARPLVAIPGQLPLPHERPDGCNFGPRCDFFRAGTCDHGFIKMEAVPDQSGHMTRCRRFKEIDWKTRPKAAEAGAAAEAGPIVLRVEELKKYYEIRDSSLMAIIRGQRVRTVKANEKIDFVAREAETVALVGESGCGKSTLAKVLLGLETATEGRVVLDNQDLGQVPVQKRRPQTVSHLQMVFQNPFDTLNPSHSVGGQIARVIRKFGVEQDPEKVRERVMHLLDIVKLPRDFYFRRPRQLSGGQKQRVGIARAFAGNPRVVVADEPVSALDVSVQAAVSQLLDGDPAREPDDSPFHQPRSVAGPLPRRPRGGDVSRHDRRAGHHGRSVPAALSPLHRGALVRDPDRRHLGAQEGDRARGRHPIGDEPALGLPVPDPLPAQTGKNLRGAGAADPGVRQGPQDRLPHRPRGASAHGAGDRHGRQGSRRVGLLHAKPAPRSVSV